MTDEMIRMLQLAQQGFQCSQILLLMGLEAQGKDNVDLVRVMSALAGGLGFSGDICGTLTGGACMLGLYAGRGRADEEEDPRLNIMIGELVEWFTTEHGRKYGGIRCEEILSREGKEMGSPGPAIVLATFQKVKDLLVENGLDLAGAGW